MRIVRNFLVIAACAIGPHALAAEAVAPSATAEAERILAADGVGDLFADVSEGELPKLRHTGSGLVCSFSPGGLTNRALVVYSPLPRGDDVACTTDFAGGWQTLYATRHTTPVTEEQLLATTVTEIGLTVAGLKPYRGVKADPVIVPEVVQYTVRYEGAIRGVPVFTRVSVAKVDAWTIMQRVTATADRTIEADVRAEAEFAAVLLGLRRK